MNQNELMGFAGLLRMRIPSPKERKRSMPRGLLGKSFWDRQFKEVQELVEDWGYEVELRPGAKDAVVLGEEIGRAHV